MKKILSMMRVDVNLVWGWYLLVTAATVIIETILFRVTLNTAVLEQYDCAEISRTLAQTAQNSHFIWVFLAGFVILAFMPEAVWIERKGDGRCGYLTARLNMSRGQIFAAHALLHFLLLAGYWGLHQGLYIWLAGQYMTKMEAAGALGLNSQTILGAGFEYSCLQSLLPAGMPMVLLRNLLIIISIAVQEAEILTDQAYGKNYGSITIHIIWAGIFFDDTALSSALGLQIFLFAALIIVTAVRAYTTGGRGLYPKKTEKTNGIL